MFQSTPPMQGATRLHSIQKHIFKSFNPRPLCRERPVLCFLQYFYCCFNPRPLCRERQQFQPKILPYFQQKSTNYHFKYLNFPFFIPSSSTKHAVCAHLRVRIPRHFYVRFLFALLYYHKINVSSTAIPRSTPICSTFV